MNKRLIFLTSFLFVLFLIVSSAKVVFSCSDRCYSRGPANCSDPQCADCTECTGQVYNPALPKKLSDTSGTTFLQNILQLGIKLGFVIGAIIFFFMLISGGIKWISSAGDKTRLEGAQKQITHALIGLAILLSIFAIIRLLDYIFGINLLQINLPTL